MQSQIYRILADRSGKPLRQIIRDTQKIDIYLDAAKTREHWLLNHVTEPAAAEPEPLAATEMETAAPRDIAAHADEAPQ
jgi:ATP-dependent protease ClpP protease subunit